MLLDFDGAPKILRYGQEVCSHLANCMFLLLPCRRANNYVFKVCQKKAFLSCAGCQLFMTVVHLEEPKELEFSRCPEQTMMHTEAGVMSGLEKSGKPVKCTRILEDRSMMTRSR